MTRVNRQVTLASRPTGLPKLSDFELVYSPLPKPGPGDVLVRAVYLSLDPEVRGQMNAAGAPARSIAIGDVMTGGAVAFVVESRDPAFAVGDAVEGNVGWQEYAVFHGHDLRKLDLALAPISTALGVLGTPGLTALFGLLDICDPKSGETVVVSGATGAIGMLVGQIARIRGCRVVGVAGAGAKVSWLVDELGFDAALSYETPEELHSQLAELCPDGIDVYFDTVGGSVTDAAMRRINARSRISVCSQSSQDSLEVPEVGPRWLGQLIVQEAKVQGFLVSGYEKRFPEGLAQLADWLRKGKIQYREEIAQGIEAAPQAFIGMLQEKNHGKQLVRLSASTTQGNLE